MTPRIFDKIAVLKVDACICRRLLTLKCNRKTLKAFIRNDDERTIRERWRQSVGSIRRNNADKKYDGKKKMKQLVIGALTYGL